jgi:molybdopterin/thiamine biosynthesis adenylyltransferase
MKRPSMQFSYKEMVSRNIGTISLKEQAILRNASVAIAGTGGVGGLLAERLVRLGIGKLILSDPGKFDISNLNRQFGSSTRNIGKNKANKIAFLCKEINPAVKIIVNDGGLHVQKDMDKFVRGTQVVADTMDYGLFKENIYLQRSARNNNIPYLFSSSYGFGAIVIVFLPRGITLEDYNKLPKDFDIESDKPCPISFESMMPVFPKYLWKTISKTEANKIINCERFVPVNSIGVGLNVIMIAFEIVNILLKKRTALAAPHFRYIDLHEMTCRSI